MAGLMAVPAQVFARGGEANVAAIANVPAAPTVSFADRIEMLIAQRTLMVDQIAPQPEAGSRDVAAIARRLVALQELDAFVHLTVDGLVNAAPSAALKAATDEELAPLLLVHQDELTASFVGLLELPAVSEKGWFVVSRFGAEAERNAARLLAAASLDAGFKRDLAARLRALAAEGEASREGVAALAGVKTAGRQ